MLSAAVALGCSAPVLAEIQHGGHIEHFVWIFAAAAVGWVVVKVRGR